MENILGTDANNPDTDGDGYDDLAEIKNGYSPLTSEKYTEDEWGNVRDVIKGEDRDFYEREFGVPAVSQISTPSSAPVVAKKCEYPEKIGEYSKQIVENIPLYDEKDKTKVTGQGLFFSYYLSNFNIINGLFFDLENEGEVKVRISDLLKNGGESCSIGNIAGVCVFKGDLVNKDENLGLDFIWTNGKTVKMAMTAFTLFSLTKEEVANLKGIEEINEKVKKNLIPFVAQFKDCNVK